MTAASVDRAMADILVNEAACESIVVDDVVGLVERATRSTFYGIVLTDEQLAANDRIPRVRTH